MTGHSDNPNRPTPGGPPLRRPARPVYDIARPDDPSRLTIVGAPLDIDPPAPVARPQGYAQPGPVMHSGHAMGSAAISSAGIANPTMPELRHSRPLLAPSRRRYTFMLTAFADAMFQLLIFFMLATNLDAFSLLTISQGGETSGVSDTETDASIPPVTLGQTALWTLSRDGITAGGQRFGFDQLPQLAKGALIAGTEQVLLITRPDSNVQGVVHVLEALNQNGIESVQIISANAYEQGLGK